MIRRILDIFHQEPQDDILSHWCVQYMEEGKTFVDYEYFGTWTEANEYAQEFGYED